jgi:para-aminobenzoate synthetase/4-amino-4-deoxychorismate lyase
MGRLCEFASDLDRPRKVRVLLSSNGKLTVEVAIPVAVAKTPIDSSDPFLRHKTSRREVYERALTAHPNAKDVLLWNERGELTETCHGNLVLEIVRRRLIPRGFSPGPFAPTCSTRA